MKQGLFLMAAALAMTPSMAMAQGTVMVSAPMPMTVAAQSSEYRFQLDFHVPDAALAKMLPAGWLSNAVTQGAAKDANIRLIFIEEANITGPDNKLLGAGSDLLVYLAAPVKSADGTGIGQMILGGISQNDQAAAFGVLDKASLAKASRTVSTANGVTLVTEDWDFAAANGEHASLHVKYARAPASRVSGMTNFYNPADPTSLQMFKTEQATDITRNVTTNPPDRVSEFSYHAGGGKFAALFDGSEKVLSWDSQPVYSRAVSAPMPGVPAKSDH